MTSLAESRGRNFRPVSIWLGAFSLVTTALLTGCVGGRVDRLPPGTEFHVLRSVADLAGTYQDHGISHSGEWQPRLSEYLLPHTATSDAPLHIRLTASNDHVLRCEALQGETIIATRDLVEERDLRLVDGHIRLAGTLDEAGVMEGGIGVGTETGHLDLTTGGDLVLTCDRLGAGLMLFIIPMACRVREEAVFRRVGPAPGTPPS